MSATPTAKKTAINPHNVWKPEDYFNIYLQPGMEKTPTENAGWAQGARKGAFVFISGQTPTLPDGTTISKDMHAQLRQALVNFRNVVAAEGGRSRMSSRSATTSARGTWRRASLRCATSVRSSGAIPTHRQPASRSSEWRGPTTYWRSKVWRCSTAT